jgi:hypothetical protein
MRKYQLVLLSVSFSLLILSCKQKEPKNDDQISTSVTSTTRVIDQNVKVSVQDGVVTLSGEVADEETKTATVNAVKHIEGVKSINNNLTVKAVTTPGPEKKENRENNPNDTTGSL